MGKTVLQLLETKIGLLTPGQKKVADYIIKNPTEVAFMTTKQLSELVGVSVATIMRLAYALGYTGYAQFQKALQELLRNRVAPPNRLEANLKRVGNNNLLIKCAETQIANIRKTVEILSDKVINKAFNIILSAKKIYVIGVRTSFPAAAYLNDCLNLQGIDCELLIPDTVRLQAILTRITSKDLVIAISLPRYSKRVLEIVKVAKSKDAKILSITNGYSSPFASLSDVILACSFESLAFHRSVIGIMFVIDFLVTGMAVKGSDLVKSKLEEIEKVVEAIDSNVIN